MNLKNVIMVGLGIGAGLAINRLMSEESKHDISMTASYLKEQFKPKDADDIDYVSDDELTDAMEISKDDTPDNVDMLFIDIIRFDNLSAAYSTMGEVMRSLENEHTSVSVHDILGWLTEYSDSDDTKRYVHNIKLQYGSKLENYGWVDPSDFMVTHNNTLDCYTITTIVPVRLRATCDEEE